MLDSTIPACPMVGLWSNGGILSGPGGSREGGFGESTFARLAAGALSPWVLVGSGRFAIWAMIGL